MGEEGFIGEIRIFAGNFAPRNWAFCEGQLIAISQNEALFSIIGTIYGGDGRTTFGLPDLRGRSAAQQGNGAGLSPLNIGDKRGVVQNTLTANQLPSHNHSVKIEVNSKETGETDPTKFLGTGEVYAKEAASPVENMKGIVTEYTGSNQAMNNMQPYLPLHYVICTYGIFPSRS